MCQSRKCYQIHHSKEEHFSAEVFVGSQNRRFQVSTGFQALPWMILKHFGVGQNLDRVWNKTELALDWWAQEGKLLEGALRASHVVSFTSYLLAFPRAGSWVSPRLVLCHKRAGKYAWPQYLLHGSLSIHCAPTTFKAQWYAK